MSGSGWNGRTDLYAGLAAGVLAVGVAVAAQYVPHADTSIALYSFAGTLVAFALAALRRYTATRTALPETTDGEP